MSSLHIQYDEWQEIYDDIFNGYHDCCSKEIFYKLLKPYCIYKKSEIYETLKKCIAIKYQNLCIDMEKAFSVCINKNVANIILESFKRIVKGEEVSYFLHST